MSYVDGYVVPVKREKLEEYRAMCQKSADLYKRNGAIEYYECIADDVQIGKVTSFPQSVKLESDEVVVFSWVVYPSKEHRDRAMKEMMNDPTMQQEAAMPFDGQRMFFGGFKPLFEMHA